MPRSRLNTRLEKETKQRIAYSVIGAIAILLLLLKFGIPLFSRFALFVSDKTASSNTTSVDQAKPSYISPPTLNATFTATNSAQIKVTGQADKNEQIKLFVNGNAQDTVMANMDGSFVFDSVTLTEGQNTIQVKEKVNDQYSDFSNPLSVSYSKKGPDLSVDTPADGSTVKDKNLTVSGKTNSEATVTINDHVAIVNGDGSYSYTLQLQNGDNQLKIIAQDSAGNKTEKDVKVTYSP